MEELERFFEESLLAALEQEQTEGPAPLTEGRVSSGLMQLGGNLDLGFSFFLPCLAGAVSFVYKLDVNISS